MGKILRDFYVFPIVALRNQGQILQPPPVEVTQGVGGRLIFYASMWPKINLDAWVLCTVSEGYKIEFTKAPPARAVT